MKRILLAEEALTLLKTHILVSKANDMPPLYYMLSTNGTIIVTNETRKYNLNTEDFKASFYDSEFYLYLSLKELKNSECEIDQEFRKLRQ